MKRHSVTFRCPSLLLEKIDEIAALSGRPRSAVLVEMVRLFAEELEKRDDRLLPSYEGESLQEHFEALRQNLRPRETEEEE